MPYILTDVIGTVITCYNNLIYNFFTNIRDKKPKTVQTNWTVHIFFWLALINKKNTISSIKHLSFSYQCNLRLRVNSSFCANIESVMIFHKSISFLSSHHHVSETLQFLTIWLISPKKPHAPMHSMHNAMDRTQLDSHAVQVPWFLLRKNLV